MRLKHRGNDSPLAHHKFQHLLRLLNKPEGHYLVEVAPEGMIYSGSTIIITVLRYESEKFVQYVIFILAIEYTLLDMIDIGT